MRISGNSIRHTFRKDHGGPVALLPGQTGGYCYHDTETGKRVRLNTKTETLFETGAICFYRPLPLRKIGITDLMLYMKRCVSAHHIVYAVLAVLAISAVGQLIPRLTAALTGPALDSGQANALIGVAVCLLCFSVVTALVEIGISRKELEHAAKESDMSYAMISGVQKIKLAGAEKRVFAR